MNRPSGSGLLRVFAIRLASRRPPSSAGEADETSVASALRNELLERADRDLLLPHLSSRGGSTLNGPDLVAVVKTLQERAQTLEEMAERALFYYKAPESYDEAALAKFEKSQLAAVFTAVAAKLNAAEAATVAEFDQLFKDICTENGWKMPQVGQPVRIALSGGTQAPGIGEIVLALGVAETVRRIEAAQSAVAG